MVGVDNNGEHDDKVDEKTNSSARGAGTKRKSVLSSTIAELLEHLPENFSYIRNVEKSEPLLETDNAPFVVVALQEWCVSRLNCSLFDHLLLMHIFCTAPA